jgi:hypothetical protein
VPHALPISSSSTWSLMMCTNLEDPRYAVFSILPSPHPS